MFPDLMRDDVFRLETGRLWLRWPRASDVGRIAEYAGDRDVAQMTARIPHPYPPGAAAEFVLMARAGNLQGRQITLALAIKQRPNEPVGIVDLREAGPRKAIIGFWLGKPFWGQGLMSEAVCALLGLAFRAANLDSIVGAFRPGNTASQRVMLKAGFAPDGREDIDAPARGGSIASERLLLTRALWQGCPPQGARQPALAQAR